MQQINHKTCLVRDYKEITWGSFAPMVSFSCQHGFMNISPAV